MWQAFKAPEWQSLLCQKSDSAAAQLQNITASNQSLPPEELSTSLCICCADVIAEARQHLSDDQGTVNASGKKRRQRTALQAMLEARDDNGNPVKPSSHESDARMASCLCVCLIHTQPEAS